MERPEREGGCCGDQPRSASPVGASTAACESAYVTVRFLGYHRVAHGSGEIIDSVELFLPDSVWETQVGGLRSLGREARVFLLARRSARPGSRCQPQMRRPRSAQASYIRLPPSVRAACRAAGFDYRESVHAAAHAVLNALPLFMACDAGDVATECDNPYDTVCTAAERGRGRGRKPRQRQKGICLVRCLLTGSARAVPNMQFFSPPLFP
jgi:hypothetical protein